MCRRRVHNSSRCRGVARSHRRSNSNDRATVGTVPCHRPASNRLRPTTGRRERRLITAKCQACSAVPFVDAVADHDVVSDVAAGSELARVLWPRCAFQERLCVRSRSCFRTDRAVVEVQPLGRMNSRKRASSRSYSNSVAAWRSQPCPPISRAGNGWRHPDRRGPP